MPLDQYVGSVDKSCGCLKVMKKLWVTIYNCQINYESTQKAENQTKVNIFLSLMESELSLFKENDPLLLQVVASSSGVLKS